MEVISTTIDYNGTAIKVEKGRVFCRAFGTTIYRQNDMHWSWAEIKPKNELKAFLIKNNLLR